MKEKRTFEGRSLVFNAAFVVLNLCGLAMLVLGYHESAGSSATLFKTIGWIAMMFSIGGLILFKGRLMMSTVARVFVGALFIVSGLVKANDPLGFSYKLEEYFQDGALAYRIKTLFGAPGFSLEFLMDSALSIAVFIAILEIVLGVIVLIGGKIKLTAYLLLSMVLFFTFLTWHTADCKDTSTYVDHDTYLLSNPKDAAMVAPKLVEAASQKAKELEAKKAKKSFKKTTWVVEQSKDEIVIAETKKVQCVTDCGCFGDALKGSVGRSLTPDESYWKDIVLLYLIVWIFLAQWITKPNTKKQNVIIGCTATLLVGFFSWVFGWYFPIFFTVAAYMAALWIWRVGGRYFGNYYASAILVAILSSFVVMYVLRYEPIKDYRPYAVGSNLMEKMNDGVPGKSKYFYFVTDLRSKKTRRVEMSQIPQKVWDNPQLWKAKFDKIEVVVKDRNASIMDFNPSISFDDLSNDERNCSLLKPLLKTETLRYVQILNVETNDTSKVALEEFQADAYPQEKYTIIDTLTEQGENPSDLEIKTQILAQKRIVLVVSRDLSEGAWQTSIPLLKAIQLECAKKKVPFIVICSGTRSEINAFKKKYNFHVPIFTMDVIELKVITRSNPAVLVLEKAVVKAKYAHRSIPDGKTFKTKHLD